MNTLHIGSALLTAQEAFETAEWACSSCGFVHARDSPLPFSNWPKRCAKAGTLTARRFWQAFFLVATERQAYCKQCNTCGRVLPFSSFARHASWGPLERQMECRACKAGINAILNKKRTPQQLHEGSVRRRAGDLLTEADNQPVDIKELFERFNSRCFKTGQLLRVEERRTWAIDHILPSRYLYPLTASNAALLSREANETKRDRWPRDFYTNEELIRLAEITGADLSLISSPNPVLNQRIDVNKCVTRALSVREQSKLHKRVLQLRQFIIGLGLDAQLTPANKKLLGME